MKDAKGHGSDPRSDIAHQTGVSQIGQPIMSMPRVQTGDMVSGLRVESGVPNSSSIGASMSGDYEEHGIREIPFSAFEDNEAPVSPSRYTRDLADQIKQNGFIKPLIAVHDSESPKRGPYILEGAHRFDALKLLGKKSFPAHVVEDRS